MTTSPTRRELADPACVLFGEARFLEAIGRGWSLPWQAIVAALGGEVERWRGASSAQDDISILAVEVSVAWDRG